MQAGEKLEVRLRAASTDGRAVRGTAVAAFFAPGKDPQRVPADREPDRTAVLAFDEVTRTYAAQVSTAGWAAGAWTVRGTVLGPDGAADGWGYCTVLLGP